MNELLIKKEAYMKATYGFDKPAVEGDQWKLTI
jgi:hypothetical protein